MILTTLFYLISFILVVSLIVFIHEFGHFLASRMFGVKVLEFAIGFGKTLFSFTDKKGTKWKFCLIPVGGYVMNFGDEGASSAANLETITNMSEEDKKISMFAQHPIKKIIIALAGPFANFFSAWVFLLTIFMFYGYLFILPIISEVASDSPAEKAGLLQNDRIIAINEQKIDNFLDVKRLTMISLDKSMVFTIERNGEIEDIVVYPQRINTKTSFGNDFQTNFLGISAAEISFKKLPMHLAAQKAFVNSWSMIETTIIAVKQLIFGKRSIKEMGGPIQIANHAGKAVKQGFWSVINLIVLISMSLGVMNLLPIPSLDGSHVLFYTIEMFCNDKGKENLLKVQNITFRIGMLFLIILSVVISYNDLKILILKILQ